MKRYLLTGICGLALACGAAAGDLNRCRDDQGHVLLTDQSCAQSGMAPDTVATEVVAPVPEPTTWLMLGAGLAVLGARKKLGWFPS